LIRLNRIRSVASALLLVIPCIASPQNGQRLLLEQEVRVRLGRVLKAQVGLTDAQISRIEDVHLRIEERRVALSTEEGRARNELRDELTIGDSSHNAAIAQVLDQLFKAQRERNLLNEEEQKQLAQFLTPMQRAKYFAVEETIRRRVNQMMRDSVVVGRGGRGAVIPSAWRKLGRALIGRPGP
jgi:Spy/CpxP family protein refolding chaperone